MAKEKKFKYQWKEAWMTGYGPKSPISRYVLLALLDYMNDNGGSCFPSQETLAKRTGLGIRTVRKHIKILAEAGWIKILKRGSRDKTHKRNTYQATIPSYASKKEKPKTNEEEPDPGWENVPWAIGI